MLDPSLYAGMVRKLKRGTRNDRRVNQRVHAKRRAKERYDIDLTTEDLREMSRNIQNNDVETHRGSITNTRTFHVLNWRGQELPVVYDKIRKVVVTFLPIETLNTGPRAMNKKDEDG